MCAYHYSYPIEQCNGMEGRVLVFFLSLWILRDSFWVWKFYTKWWIREQTSKIGAPVQLFIFITATEYLSITIQNQLILINLLISNIIQNKLKLIFINIYPLFWPIYIEVVGKQENWCIVIIFASLEPWFTHFTTSFTILYYVMNETVWLLWRVTPQEISTQLILGFLSKRGRTVGPSNLKTLLVSKKRKIFFNSKVQLFPLKS